MDRDSVAGRLALGARREAWLRALDDRETSPTFALPDRDHAADALGLLAVPGEDVDAVLSVWPDPARDPEIWWLLERCHARFVAAMGDVDAFVECPPLPRALGLQGRCFWVFAFASMVPVTCDLHARRGVPDDISRATLADLGQQMVIHRRRHGTIGLDLQWWLVPHFLGTLYALGRLQFHLYRLRRGIAGPAFWPDSDEPGFRSGDAALGIHIPAIGPLTSESCDASFAAARSFVANHFPEHDFRVGTCTSWLLDDQLAGHLPADSNIVRFQRRFHVVDGATDDGRDTLLFVFDRVPDSLDELPQRTTLERAIVQHLRQGGRWRTRTGWVAL
ncbi:MAG TPA: acyltransferase domain-containing protein [Acidimicrobiales bacterium]|nr:acyltransferase domain-containing protein [Acidimicrobiales bacterium]